jgi:hypothetical protein
MEKKIYCKLIIPLEVSIIVECETGYRLKYHKDSNFRECGELIRGAVKKKLNSEKNVLNINGDEEELKIEILGSKSVNEKDVDVKL